MGGMYGSHILIQVAALVQEEGDGGLGGVRAGGVEDERVEEWQPFGGAVAGEGCCGQRLERSQVVGQQERKKIGRGDGRVFLLRCVLRLCFIC